VRAVLALLLLVAAFVARATDYCVDADSGSDSNDGISTYSAVTKTCPSSGGHAPWATVGRHNGSAQANAITGLLAVGPGDNEYIVGSDRPYTSFFLSGIPGTAAAPVTFAGVAGVNRALPLVISVARSNGQAVNLSSGITYTTVSNIEVWNPNFTNQNGACILVGSSGDGALSFASTSGNFTNGETVTQATSGASATLLYYDVTNKLMYLSSVTGAFDTTHVVTGGTSGKTGTPTGVSGSNIHHILLDKVKAHGCGGTGIGTTWVDYITVSNSEIYDVDATVATYSGSGISLYNPTVFVGDDGSPGRCYGVTGINTVGYRNCVLNNRIWNTTPGLGAASDGNGIIIDNWTCSQHPSDNCAGANYPYGALIQGNTVFNNQGRGIHIYTTQPDLTKGNGVVVDNNTGWNNCTVLNTPCPNTAGDFDSLGFGGVNSFGAFFTHNTIVAPYYAINVTSATGGTVRATCNNNNGTSGQTRWDSTGTFTTTSSISSNPQLTAPAATPPADFRPTGSTPSPGC
jgi:hypothetical protein